MTFSGALAWPYLYPWPQRPPGLIETAFDELAKRWKPILDAYDEAGVDVGFEIHPGEDLFDGATFEMFLERVGGHPRCGINYDPSHFVLQQLDYLDFIDIYHERINAFHVKDAEFNPTGRQGVYSGFQGWVDRAGRFRSLGDGQVDFGAIFSKLAQYDYDGWAVLEWECASSIPSRAPPKARRSSRATSSASPSTPSTTSPAARPTSRPTSAHWGSRSCPSREAASTSRGASASAWSAAARAPSSAPCTASPRASTTSTSSSPARCPPSPSAPGPRALELGPAPTTAPTAATRRWRAREARLEDGIEAVAIVTPNHMHFPVAKAFLKPASTSSATSR